jgi:hypothetical protein
VLGAGERYHVYVEHVDANETETRRFYQKIGRGLLIRYPQEVLVALIYAKEQTANDPLV